MAVFGFGAYTAAVLAGVELRVRDAVRSFGGVRAVDGVSLHLAPAAVHGLIGPNGSGKTTILNLVSGYYALDAETVHLGTRRLDALSVPARVRVGVARTFQTPQRSSRRSTAPCARAIGSTPWKPAFAHHARSPELSATELLDIMLRGIGVRDRVDRGAGAGWSGPMIGPAGAAGARTAPGTTPGDQG